jgi:hypothetical protein
MGAKIFTKGSEDLATPFNTCNPNAKLLLYKSQVRSEGFEWNDLFTQELLLTFCQLTDNAACSKQHFQEESSRYLKKATRKRQNNYQFFVCLTNTVDKHT